MNVRLPAKLEVSWRPFVSLCDQWAVACLNKFLFADANFKKNFLHRHLNGLLARRTVENAGLATDRGREGREWPTIE